MIKTEDRALKNKPRSGGGGASLAYYTEGRENPDSKRSRVESSTRKDHLPRLSLLPELLAAFLCYKQKNEVEEASFHYSELDFICRRTFRQILKNIKGKW